MTAPSSSTSRTALILFRGLDRPEVRDRARRRGAEPVEFARCNGTPLSEASRSAVTFALEALSRLRLDEEADDEEVADDGERATFFVWDFWLMASGLTNHFTSFAQSPDILDSECLELRLRGVANGSWISSPCDVEDFPAELSAVVTDRIDWDCQEKSVKAASEGGGEVDRVDTVEDDDTYIAATVGCGRALADERSPIFESGANGDNLLTALMDPEVLRIKSMSSCDSSNDCVFEPLDGDDVEGEGCVVREGEPCGEELGV
jgi:hypothetical protein